MSKSKSKVDKESPATVASDPVVDTGADDVDDKAEARSALKPTHELAVAKAAAKPKPNKSGFEIAPGKALTSPRGILGPGDECSEKDFKDFAGLKRKGFIVKS